MPAASLQPIVRLSSRIATVASSPLQRVSQVRPVQRSLFAALPDNQPEVLGYLNKSVSARNSSPNSSSRRKNTLIRSLQSLPGPPNRSTCQSCLHLLPLYQLLQLLQFHQYRRCLSQILILRLHLRRISNSACWRRRHISVTVAVNFGKELRHSAATAYVHTKWTCGVQC